MASVNTTFFLSLCIIGIGFLLKKVGILSEKDGKTLSRVIFNITLPGVILYTIPSVQLNLALFIMPVICILFSLGLLAIILILYRGHTGEMKGVLLMSTLGFNVGNFAYPLIEGVYGAQGLQYMAMFDVGNAIIMFVVNYSIAAIHSPKMVGTETHVDPKAIGKKILSSIPLMCYFIGLAMNIAKVQFPLFVIDVLSIISRANMAIVLLTLGVFLNFNFEKTEWSNMAKVVAIRYIAGIIAGLILFVILPFDYFTRLMIIIAFIIPIGMAIITYGVEFEYSEKSQQIIGTLTNITLVISFFLMWVLIALLGPA